MTAVGVTRPSLSPHMMHLHSPPVLVPDCHLSVWVGDGSVPPTPPISWSPQRRPSNSKPGDSEALRLSTAAAAPTAAATAAAASHGRAVAVSKPLAEQAVTAAGWLATAGERGASCRVQSNAGLICLEIHLTASKTCESGTKFRIKPTQSRMSSQHSAKLDSEGRSRRLSVVGGAHEHAPSDIIRRDRKRR